MPALTGGLTCPWPISIPPSSARSSCLVPVYRDHDFAKAAVTEDAHCVVSATELRFLPVMETEVGVQGVGRVCSPAASISWLTDGSSLHRVFTLYLCVFILISSSYKTTSCIGVESTLMTSF